MPALTSNFQLLCKKKTNVIELFATVARHDARATECFAKKYEDLRTSEHGLFTRNV